VAREELESQRERLRVLLREIRRERGVQQAELARRLDLPQSYVSKYETGERRLEFVAVEAICEALEVPFLELVQRWQEEKP
jgi:transcriptional regulator with XRE-family HTH domain